MPFELRDTPATTEEQRDAREALSRPLDLQDLEAEARKILGGEADAWLDAENVNLGGKTPRELLNGCNKEVVRELLDNIRYGAFS